MRCKSINLKKNKYLKRLLHINILLFATCSSINAETLRLAVASNFLKTAQQLVIAFEKEYQHNVQISSGSSGKLYLQITKGAPFDLFLSADQQKPQALMEQKLVIKSSLKTYAVGKLLLWIKSPIESCYEITDLKNINIVKIAMANPKLAPYGEASQRFLQNNQLWKAIKHKIILSENISQVAQLVKIGVVDAAFISASHQPQLQNIKQSCFFELPRNHYPAIKQQLAIISSSKKVGIAQKFIFFMQSPKGQDLIKNMGYYSQNSDKIEL